MFGFSKKNNNNNEALIIASEIVNILHKTVDNKINELDEYFKNKLNRTHFILPYVFYLQKHYLSLDYIGYLFGFIEGYIQDKKLDEETKSNVIAMFVKSYDKTIVNHRNHFSLSSNEDEWANEFLSFISNKTFLTDEEASDWMMMGLAEGSGCSKALKTIEGNYSALLDSNTQKTGNLSNLERQIHLWSSALLLDKDKIDYIEIMFLENGQLNPNFEEDWIKRNKKKVSPVSDLFKKSPKVKKSVSKYKRYSNDLKSFIENYEIELKEDEDYYEHDISFDEEKNQFHCKIEVVLKNEQDKSYPFIEFQVDFSNKDVTFEPKSINSDTYQYQDIEDLKEIIEEEIDKQ